MADVVEELFNREAVLRQERSLLDGLWRKINEYVTPYDYEIDTESLPGAERGQAIYDGTAQDGGATAVNTLISATIPTDLRNFTLAPTREEVKESKEALRWYDATSNIVFKALATSNLRNMSHAAYHDLVHKGTCSLLMGPSKDQKQIIFRAFPVGSYVISENDEGFVDTLFQAQKMTVRNVVAMAEKLGPGASASSELRSRYSDGKLDEKVSILHVADPRPGVEAQPGMAPKERPWRSLWIERDTKHIIHEGGFYHCPYKVARGMQYPGFPYGFSRLMNVLADVKVLNRLKELALKSVNLAVDPTILFQRNEELLKRGKRFRRHPGELIPMRDINAIRPFDPGEKVDVAQFAIAELQQAILKGLGVDRMQIEPASGDTQRSATEIANRIATNNRQLGPMYSKIEDELLEPIVLYTLLLEAEAGRIPPPPQEVFVTGGRSFLDISVRFEGALARQSRQIDLQSLMDLFNLLAFVFQVHPEGKDNFNLDYYCRLIPQSLGFNEAGLVPERVVIATRQQRAEDQRMMAISQAALQAAEIQAKSPQPEPPVAGQPPQEAMRAA